MQSLEGLGFDDGDVVGPPTEVATEKRMGLRQDGLQRLQRFVPQAGRDYQRFRNVDRGRGEHWSVSSLSPYIRHRLISEQEVLDAVLSEHAREDAFKFVQEVFWRGYWKGWLEHRQRLWPEYQAGLQDAEQDLKRNNRAYRTYLQAVSASTPIIPFNDWVTELQETGYLHNHARMWFASIWVFSLGLPWQLGADFFMRHLLDGDPAVNTLGWRWVAGLHTQGKTYLATPTNIRQCADGRFDDWTDYDRGLNWLAARTAQVEEELTACALQVTGIEWPAPLMGSCPDYRGKRTALLLTEEDLAIHCPLRVDAVVALSPGNLSPIGEDSSLVTDFRRRAVVEGLEHATVLLPAAKKSNPMDPEALASWLANEKIDLVVHAYVPMGPALMNTLELQQHLAARGIAMVSFMSDYDRMVWPHARKGFFQLGKKIPEFLDTMALGSPETLQPDR